MKRIYHLKSSVILPTLWVAVCLSLFRVKALGLQIIPNGNYANGSGTSFSYTFNTVGSYVLSVSGQYCPPDPINIKVVDLPAKPEYVEGAAIVCLNMPYVYSAGDIEPGTRFEWEIEGGTILYSSFSQATVIWTANTGTLRAYRTSLLKPECRSANAATISVTKFNPANLSIQAVAGNSRTNCTQSFMVFYNGLPYNEADDYEWYFANVYAGSVTGNGYTYNPTVLYNNQPGTTYLQLTLQKCNQRYKNVASIAVNIQNVPLPNVTPNAPEVCSGVPITFTITNSSEYSYCQYDAGNGNVDISGSAFTLTFNNATGATQTQHVKVTGYLCNVPYVKTITVNVTSGPVIELNPDGVIAVCQGSPVNCNLTVSYTGSLPSISWYKNGSMVGTGLSYTATALGSYYVVATSGGCSSVSNTVNIVSINCSGGGGTLPSCGDFSITVDGVNCGEVKLTVTPSSGYLYTWDSYNPDLQPLTSLNGSTVRYRAARAGLYRIGVLITNSALTCANYVATDVVIPVVLSAKADFSCQNNLYTATVTNTSSTYGGSSVSYSYKWDNATIFTPIDAGGAGTFPNLAHGSAHTFTLKATGTNINCTYTFPVTIPSLSAAFTATPNPVCSGVPVSFSPQYGANVADLIWTFDPPAESRGISTQRTFMFPDPNIPDPDPNQPTNTYPATLKVFDKYGCYATTTQYISVYRNALNGNIQTTPSYPVCEGTPVQLKANPSGANVSVSYRWHHNNATTQTTYTYYSGSFTTTLTDYYGCHFVPDNMSVQVVIIPDITFFGATEVCQGDNIEISGYCGDDVSYVWNRLSPSYIPNVGSSAVLQLSATTPGNYEYELIVTSIFNATCSKSSTVAVTVHPTPNMPTIGVSSLSCQPYLLQLSVNSPQAGSYRWSNGNAGNPITVDQGGPYAVFYTDQHGCQSASNPVSVPHSPEYYFWTFPQGCYSLCWRELPVVHGPVCFPQGETWQWQWLENGNTIAGGSAPSYSSMGLNPPLDIYNSAAYQMRLSNQYCTATTNSMNVNMLKCSECEFDIYIKTICIDPVTEKLIIILFVENPFPTPFNYNMSSMSGYLITPASGTLQQGQNTIVLTMDATGASYPIYENFMFLMWDPYKEEERCIKWLYYRIDEINCEDGIPLNPYFKRETITHTDADHINVYPNPTTAGCDIEYDFTKEDDYTFIVRDVTGRTLYKTSLFGQKGSLYIDLSPFTESLYLIECRNGSRIISVHKIVKTN